MEEQPLSTERLSEERPLTNACRHNKSSNIRVELVQQGDQIRVEVEDHGVGFDPAEINDGHFGVAGILQRARLLGGTAAIESRTGAGTRILVELPIVLQRPEDEPAGDSDW
jgi:signal transduction histidine kinase